MKFLLEQSEIYTEPTCETACHIEGLERVGLNSQGLKSTDAKMRRSLIRNEAEDRPNLNPDGESPFPGFRLPDNAFKVATIPKATANK